MERSAVSRLGGCAVALLISMVALVAALPSAGVADTYEGQNDILHVSPPSVAPGERVTVSGSGFAPGAGVSVTVHSREVGLGSGITNASGSLIATMTVPVGASPGRHELVAVGQAAQGGTLTLRAGINISSGAAGRLPFTGSGTAVPFALTGMCLIGLGGVVILTVRRRRKPV